MVHYFKQNKIHVVFVPLLSRKKTPRQEIHRQHTPIYMEEIYPKFGTSVWEVQPQHTCSCKDYYPLIIITHTNIRHIFVNLTAIYQAQRWGLIRQELRLNDQRCQPTATLTVQPHLKSVFSMSCDHAGACHFPFLHQDDIPHKQKRSKYISDTDGKLTDNVINFEICKVILIHSGHDYATAWIINICQAEECTIMSMLK